jgi:hypothetical protein
LGRREIAKVVLPMGEVYPNESFRVKTEIIGAYMFTYANTGYPPGIYWADGSFTPWAECGEYIEKIVK